jgi:hypothetical protein
MTKTPGVTTCILIFLLMVPLSLWLFKQLKSTKFNDAIINYFRIGFALRGTEHTLQITSANILPYNLCLCCNKLARFDLYPSSSLFG